MIRTVCQQCHTNPTRNNAPFSLITYEDIQRPIDGKPTYMYMSAALEAGRMPLAPGRLTDDDRKMMIDWLNEGAPQRDPTEVCEP